MKKFKEIDVWVNVGLIVLGTILSSVDIITDSYDWILLMSSYIIVGGWQVISMLIHKYNGWVLTKGRSIYHYVTLIALLIMPFGGFYLLLFIAPLMAIFYAYLCYYETYIKMRRPLSTLK